MSQRGTSRGLENWGMGCGIEDHRHGMIGEGALLDSGDPRKINSS